jgi:hypothetical protein
MNFEKAQKRLQTQKRRLKNPAMYQDMSQDQISMLHIKKPESSAEIPSIINITDIKKDA